ncbi:MAG: adenosylmethionine decarboxylase [Gammaproteobacteria bacterium]
MSTSPDHFKTDADGNAYAGDHLLVELWGAAGLDDIGLVEQTLARAVEDAGATLLHAYYHPFGDGQGVSGVAVLAESHVSIHTWPERGYAAVDVFMCGACDPQLTLPALKRGFRPERVELRHLRRGCLAATAVRSVA